MIMNTEHEFTKKQIDKTLFIVFNMFAFIKLFVLHFSSYHFIIVLHLNYSSFVHILVLNSSYGPYKSETISSRVLLCTMDEDGLSIH